MSSSLRAASLIALVSACASSRTPVAAGPRWQPLDEGATATDVHDRVAAVPEAERVPPAAPQLALDDARARWSSYSAAEAGTLAYALDVAGQGTPGQPLGPEQTSSADVTLARVDGGRVTVVYARHATRASEVVLGGHVGCNKYDHLVPGETESGPSPAPCAPRMMPPTITRRAYAADLALVVEYDRAGALLAERRFAAHPLPGPAPTPVPATPTF